MKIYNLLLLCTLVLVFGCKEEKSNQNMDEPIQLQTEMSDHEDPSMSGYAIAPFTASQEFEDASINGFSFQDGKFNFDIGGDSYVLGNQTPDADAKMCANSGKGQHIHVLLDDKPYSAQYTANFDFDIADGEHTLLAFLSRSYHESIKTEKAHVAKKIMVKDKKIVESSTIETPMIWHSRPKGTYVGKDTEKVMLDFYIENINLDDDNKVKVSIDGRDKLVDTWQPYYLTGLEMGIHTIELSVVDAQGHMVEGTNVATGAFTLKADIAVE